MKKFMLLLFITTIIVTTSCMKETYDMAPSEPETLNEIVFPSDFDWKTYRDVTFSVKGYATSVFEIKSSEGFVYQKIILQKNTSFTGKITLPFYETEVHLCYMGQDVTIELTSDELISYQFNL